MIAHTSSSIWFVPPLNFRNQQAMMQFKKLVQISYFSTYIKHLRQLLVRAESFKPHLKFLYNYKSKVRTSFFSCKPNQTNNKPFKAAYLFSLPRLHRPPPPNLHRFRDLVKVIVTRRVVDFSSVCQLLCTYNLDDGIGHEEQTPRMSYVGTLLVHHMYVHNVRTYHIKL